MVVKCVSSVEEFNICLQNYLYKSTVVNFTAKWCGPCRIAKPYFDELSKVFLTTQFLQVDVDELPEVSHWANVRAMPTFSLFKNGIKVSECVGVDQKALYEMIRKYA